MTRKLIAKALITATGCVALASAFQDLGTPEKYASRRHRKDQTVERALDYIFVKGEAWIKERKCVSCHMIPHMMWSLTAASQSGFKLPSEKAKELTQWSLEDAKSELPGSEGLAQMILAKGGRVPQEKSFIAQFVDALRNRQRADGSWGIGGQTPEQKRPRAESTEVVTMWAALALDQELGESAKPSVDRAREFISKPGPRHSNEWFVARFLFANRFGEMEVAEKMVDLLRRAQNEDGGWGWLNGMESDAIATGQTLYALSFAPKDKTSRLISRGRAFLQKTQRENGSWTVKGTLSQHKNEVMPTSVFWGTTWAVIGLCRTGGK